MITDDRIDQQSDTDIIKITAFAKDGIKYSDEMGDCGIQVVTDEVANFTAG